MARRSNTMEGDKEEVIEVGELSPTLTHVDTEEDVTDGMVNCLRNEKVIVRFVNGEGSVKDPKHVLYGGMAQGAFKSYTVPVLRSGLYVNPLTDKEKVYLEYIMGLEPNALSVYRKKDNYWDNFQVVLTKGDNVLDLSSPEDYIRYKVLLANHEFIAPSVGELEDKPKATYKYVMISESEDNVTKSSSMTSTMEAYTLFGSMFTKPNHLRAIIELCTREVVSPKSNIEYLKNKVNTIIQSDVKRFLLVVKDNLFENKVLIKRAVEGGLISNRGGYYYLKKDGTPLCLDNEEPTLNIAAKYLSLPRNQETKFTIEGLLNESK